MADLSKINVGGVLYNLKDATARQDLANLIEKLGTAAYVDTAASVAEGVEGVPTVAAVKDYVDSAVEAIPDFDVVVADGDLPAASADTFHKIYLQNATTPAAPNLYIEWITIRSGSDPNYTYSWEKIGDTAMDLSGYVQKTQTIAGVDLQDNITAAEMQDALGLKALAYKDNGTVTISTADSLSMDAFTPEGTISVNALTQTPTDATLTKGDFTPAGSITGSAISGGSVAVTLGDAAAATSATITSESITPTGNISQPTITVTPTADTIQPVTSVGTMASVDVTKFNGGSAATFTEGAFTPATLGEPTKSAFATEGVVASVGTGDDSETLIIGAANTAQAVTAQGAFSGGSKAADTFNGGSAASLGEGFFTAGSVPTLGTAKSFMTAATAALDSAPTFTGDAIANAKVTKVEYLKQVVASQEFTPVAATLGFSGTTAENVLVTGVSYNQASANGATFTGNAVAPTGNVVKSNKTVDVAFGVNA